MSDAFVLGAGFSMAISSRMPSTDALGERVLATQRSLHDMRVSTHSDICDGLSCDWPVLGSSRLPHPNFEVWLSALAEPQPYLLGPENDRRHALFTELAGVIAMEVERFADDALAGDPPDWLGRLLSSWHRRCVDAITFNYDTLVEAAVEHSELLNIDGPGEFVSHRDVGPSLFPWWEGTRRRPVTTFRYYKLHGSTDWYWDELTRAADSIVEIGIRRGWREAVARYDDEEIRHRAPGKVPMIVPPTTTKTGYFDNPVIRYLWHSAYVGLAAARRVFVIGYSLPPEDVLVRSLLRSTLRDSEVWVVNPAGEVGDRFAELGVGTLHREFCGSPVEPGAVVDRFDSLI